MYDKYKNIDEKTTQYVTFEPHTNPKESEEFTEYCITKFENGINAPYLMYDKDNNWIGTTSFDPYNEKRIAESGIYIFSDYWVMVIQKKEVKLC